MWTTILLWLGLATALANPDNEIVLILDNSCSMVAGATMQGTGETLPPNDPERAAVLGTLLVAGLASNSQDRVTVLGFGPGQGTPPRVVDRADAVRQMPYAGGTWFRPVLEEAHRRLQSSQAKRKVMVLFTDGSPSDMQRPQEAPQLFADLELDIIAMGLYGGTSARQSGQQFLEPLASSPDHLQLLDATAPDVVPQVVRAFTHTYASILGSKPIVGTLQPGDTRTFEVGRYVTEVMVTAASVRPGPPFQAELTGPKGTVAAGSTGDNGCPPSVALGNAPNVCKPPRRHYQTFRGVNDPYSPSTWTLSLPSNTAGPVEYGIILRYDLEANLQIQPTARVGDQVPVQAQLLFRGQKFADPAFFETDDFKATVKIGDDLVSLTHVGDGRFQGSWSPTVPGSARAELSFSNTWMDVTDMRTVEVNGFLDLTLRPTPNPIELGTWAGTRGQSERCQVIDLSASINADRVPVTCIASGASQEAVLSCGPVAGSEAQVQGATGQPLQWSVCVRAKSCCGSLPDAADTPFTVTFRGKHDHYAAGAVPVPVRFAVTPTSFLTCWWVELALALATLVLCWLVYGYWSPNRFDPALSIRLSSSVAGLRRSSALVLCEQPGGRRGFYRHARLCLTHEGETVRRPAGAMLVVEAGPRGSTRFVVAQGLERQDRRTRRWQPVSEEDLAMGPDPGVVYRLAGVFFRFG